ncbi:MAG: branched-chain amino acid ABC transporter permease, partial [Clostridiales bacterium]|nr:branched-chain amino acid ABC transporter permease [Clostridiales bacterium]
MNFVKSRGLTLKKAASPAAAVIALIVVGLIPSFNPGPVPAYLTILSVTVIFYIIMAVSWNIFSGPTGYVSLAAAAFYGVGIYTSVIFGSSLPLPVLMLIGGAVSFILAAIIGAITLRLRGVYFTIFTFGLVQLLINLVLWYEVTINDMVVRTIPSVGYNIVFYCLFILMVIVILAAYLIKRSRFGMALSSIGECEDAAAHIGVNTTVVKVIAFSITAFAMGAAGAARATTMISIKPEIAFSILESFLPVLMVIFGGTGSILGPVVGAVIFSVLKEQLITKWPKWYMIIFGTVMVLAILLLPKGIIGAVKEMPSIVRKLQLLLLTLIFAAVGYVFNMIMAATGIAISGLVFALLFGIVGFIISYRLLKYLIDKPREGAD